jgi:hypothetical protein
MTEDPIAGLADVALDLEASRHGLARFARELADAEHAVTAARRRLLPTRGGGHRILLASRCPAEAQQRYHVLLHLERTFPPEHDQGCVIFVGCQLLEAELDRLVTAPLMPLAGALVDALHAEGVDDSRTAVLLAWADGRMPAVFGTHGLVLLALRHACARNHPDLLSFVRQRFAPGYLDLLRSQTVDRCLNRIRNRYRNPVCHGKATFGGADYEDFARLVIAHRRFLEWDQEGPSPADPGGDSGVLHHHWRLALRPEAAALDPVAARSITPAAGEK